MTYLYLKATLYAILSTILRVFIWVTAPLWALWPTLTSNPKPWFTWLYTHDDDIYGTNKWGPPPDEWVARYWYALCWMCRNPGYGYNAYVLGLSAGPVDVVEVTLWDDPSGSRTWIHWVGDERVGFGMERIIGPFDLQWGWDDRELIPGGNLKFDFSVSLKD